LRRNGAAPATKGDRVITNRKMFGGVALTSVAATLLLIAPAAPAATVANGDFEAGNLSGWQVYNSSADGNWFAYTGTKPPLQKKKEKEEEEGEIIIIEPIKPIVPAAEPLLSPRFPPFFAPPQGSWAAVSDEEDPDTAILYQDIALEPYWTHQLTMTFYYNSFDPIFVPSPDTLSSGGPRIIIIGEEPEPVNQQVRVDVMKPTAPIDSLNPSDILTTLFASKNGDPESMAPTQLSANLTPFAGQTVRLRIANAVADNVFNAGVDGVSITSTPPDNVFKKGKLKLNKSKGTGTLTVTVPGAGVLTLTDAAATKKATTSKRKAKFVRPATVNSKAAGRVKVPLRPTAAGRKVLGKKGSLKIKALLSFTPTGGAASTQKLKATLKMKLP
jgi:hypothetical protein